MKRSSKPVPSILAAFAVAASLALTAAPSAAVECVKKGGPGSCYGTIQEAVDAATAGELINVYPGTYRGSVVVPFDKPAIKIVGKGLRPTAVRLDGSRGAYTGIDIQAADVQVRNLTVQGTAGPAISGFPGGTTVSRVRVYASGDACVTLFGGGNRVLNTAVKGCGGYGFYLSGPGGLVSGSSVAVATDGINISGDDIRVISSRVGQIMNVGIQASGANAVVRSSRVNRSGSVGIVVSGPASPMKVVGNAVLDAGAPGIIVSSLGGVGGAVGEVSGNVVAGAMGDGLFVTCASSCEGSSVAGNRVSRVVQGSGIRVNGAAPGLLVRDNLAFSNPSYGFIVEGTGLTVLENTARSNGLGYRGPAGFTITGSGHEVRRNTAVGNVSDGFRLEGGGAAFAAVTGNVARGNYGNGIVVGDTSVGMTLGGNTAAGNYVLGIHVEGGAAGTTLNSNTAKANHAWDYCDASGVASAGPSNTFGTTGCP